LNLNEQWRHLAGVHQDAEKESYCTLIVISGEAGLETATWLLFIAALFTRPVASSKRYGN